MPKIGEQPQENLKKNAQNETSVSHFFTPPGLPGAYSSKEEIQANSARRHGTFSRKRQ
jgi:hypothetical protein